MFDPDSRYAALPTATHTAADGTQVVYVTRRFLPRTSDLVPLGTVMVVADDRLDLIAARALGDPLQYWRVCDANEAMNPEALEREPGAVLLIATPP
jgi:hypothetical protein